MFSIPKNSEIPDAPAPQVLEVTIKKPLWENIGTIAWGVIKVFFVFAIIGAIAGSAEMEKQAKSPTPYEKTAIDEYFREVDTDANAKHIAFISAKGEITDQEIPPAMATGMIIAPELIKLLASAADDADIAAIVLRVDSPGGEVGASERITTTIDRINKEKKPVYVLMENMAASGGYYISTPASKIYAYPETLLGNIGVRIDSPHIQGLLEKVGIQMQTVKSGALKDMGSPFRAMTDEEQKVFQALVDESYQKFLQRVADGRHLPLETVKTLADGRIYSGTQGEKNKLVDKTVTSLGDLLVNLRAEMKTSVQLVEFRAPLSPWDEFLMTVSGTVSPLQASFSHAMGVKMQYK
ncbi:MAG: signal peptide peptidase SppA [Candidatus Peregrinibacteria bacterium]